MTKELLQQALDAMNEVMNHTMPDGFKYLGDANWLIKEAIAQPVEQSTRYVLTEENVNDLIAWLRAGQVNRAVIALEHLTPVSQPSQTKETK